MAHHDNHHRGDCPECDVGPFTRNAYWTGKLMLARDFVDEQRYFIDKLRHHNQTLHGSGVACGLKVVAHENPACRDHFVGVEPGSAIDCCGNDIMVREKDWIDLRTIPEIKKLIEKKDTAQHYLQVCISFRECTAEEVPVLYDECGCDDDRCAPNRILESYELHVHVLDELPAVPSVPAPKAPDTCCDLWDDALSGCPRCDRGDCIVLAVIPFVVGEQIVDVAPDPAPAEGFGVIDNLTYRRWLPAVAAVKQFLDCLDLCAPADGGTTTPTGPGTPTDPGTPTGPSDPTPPKPPVLTHIEDVSWKRNGFRLHQADARAGVVILFDRPVHAVDLHLHSVRILRAKLEAAAAEIGSSDDVAGRLNEAPTRTVPTICWCQLVGQYHRGHVEADGDATSTFVADPGAELVTAVQFVPAGGFALGDYRVAVIGDLVRDEKGRAVDANHLPPWLPKRPTGDGVPGGAFESWFEVVQK